METESCGPAGFKASPQLECRETQTTSTNNTFIRHLKVSKDVPIDDIGMREVRAFTRVAVIDRSVFRPEADQTLSS